MIGGKRFFFVVIIFLSFRSYSQTGWDYIKQNDNRKARQLFAKDLQKDSTDYAALTGMIYLSDIEGDHLAHEKFVNKLLTEHWSEPLYEIYPNNVSPLIDEQHELKGAILVEKALTEAAEKKRNRQFEDYNTDLRNTISHLDWSLLGPLASVNGYGHIKEYAPEVGNFDPDFRKVSIDNLELYWFRPEFSNPTGAILFTDHLPSGADGGVYYANSFFKINQTQKVLIKLARKYPIKIWVDDQLIFEDNEKINFFFDKEQIALNLTEGNHRILIKYTTGDTHDRFDSYRDTDWGESYDYESYFSDSYNSYSNYDGAIYSAKNGIVLRITDETGKLLPIQSINEVPQSYSSSQLSPELTRKSTIKYYHDQINNDPEDWFNYYLLVEAYNEHGVLRGLEKFLLEVHSQNPNSVFFKYLLSKAYLYNGKREKSYEVMNHIDLDKTPVFTVLYKSLKELDAENQPEQYLDHLNSMLEITPSSYKLISLLLSFYQDKGMDAEKKNYAKQVKEEYPQYEYLMERYLEDDHKPTDYDISSREDTRQQKKWEKRYKDKKGKRAKKRLKKRYRAYDYESLIKINKKNDDVEEVLKYYDILIDIEPHQMHYRREKAEYLYNKDRTDEALAILKRILLSDPYDSKIYELIGDIYKDKKEDQEALKYYKQAQKVKGNSKSALYGSWRNYGSTSLKLKIEQIEGQKQYKNKFNVPEFSEWIRDSTWVETFKEEESVVLGFTNEILLDEEGQAYLWGKMLIRILTEAGANSWTEYNFYQFGNLDYIKVIKPDGAEIYPETSGTFVVFKNLAPGDLIVLEGKANWSTSSERGKELSYFQRMMFHAPVNYAKIEVAVPQDTYLGYKHYKLEDNVVRSKRDNFDFYTWTYRNIPKAIEEEAVLDETDTYAMIMFSTHKDWSPIVDWYKAMTYRKLESNYEIEQILQQIIIDGMSDKEKMIAIYNWVTKEINYSFTNLLQSNYIPKNSEHTCSSKIGDCKDVATLMISMLQQEGIDAYYVLVKTNNYFHREILPSIYFDHVITGVELDGEDWYLDLTTDFYPYYVTNRNDVDAWALKIKEGVTEAFQLPNDFIDPKKNLVIHEMKCTLNNDKSLDIQVSSTHSGMRGGYIREVIHNKPKADLKTEILEYMGKGVFGNLEIIDFDFKNRDSISEPLKSTYVFKANDYSDDVLDIHFFKIPWMNGIQKHIAVLNDVRHNRLDVFQLTNTAPTKQVINIKLPVNMKLRTSFNDVSIENEFGIYQLKLKYRNGSITIEKYQEFKKEIITPQEFPEFKKFYQRILKLDNMKIVLN